MRKLQCNILPVGDFKDAVKKATSWEEFVSLGMVVREWKDKSQFVLGEIAMRVEKKYGEGSIEKLAKEIGIPVKSIIVYRWVVKKMEELDIPYYPHLSFSHYRQLVSQPEAKALTEKAADEGWSFEKLARETSDKPEKCYLCPFCKHEIKESELSKVPHS